MASLLALYLLYLFSLLLIPQATSLTCSTQQFTNNNLYSTCLDLPSLNASLHFSYDAANSSAAVAFIAAPANPNGWISWAINPTAAGMEGSQALIAFKDSAGAMKVNTYNISSYGPLEESEISYEVWDMSAEDVGGVMRIYVKLKVPGDAAQLNQVWQVGSSVTGGVPDKHDVQPANLNSKGTLNLAAGVAGTVAGAGGRTKSKKKNRHGVLNTMSWGILFPVGVIVARYLKTVPSADPIWFYVHIFCQFCAYIIGVAGWGTGVKLGAESTGVIYRAHRNFGIALFCFATLQIIALLVRPKKEHKYRFYWNIYHHGFGYGIVVLGIINVFKGLDILQPGDKYRFAYVFLLVSIVVVVVVLEVFTWRRKSSQKTKSTKPYNNNGEISSTRHEPLA